MTQEEAHDFMGLKRNTAKHRHIKTAQDMSLMVILRQTLAKSTHMPALPVYALL